MCCNESRLQLVVATNEVKNAVTSASACVTMHAATHAPNHAAALATAYAATHAARQAPLKQDMLHAILFTSTYIALLKGTPRQWWPSPATVVRISLVQLIP